jgi:hypothetical protein
LVGLHIAWVAVVVAGKLTVLVQISLLVTVEVLAAILLQQGPAIPAKAYKATPVLPELVEAAVDRRDRYLLQCL